MIHHLLKYGLLSLLMIGNISLVRADLSTDAEVLFNWAEQNYSDFFPTVAKTQTFNEWTYRFYPKTGIYVGVNKNDQSAYLLGGRFGNNPVFVGKLSDLLVQATATTGDSSTGHSAVCNANQLPPGMSINGSGNDITLTTNGACIEISQQGAFCQPESQSTASGTSVYSNNSQLNTSTSGLTINTQGIPDPTAMIKEQLFSKNVCFLNAPDSFSQAVIHYDMCFDLTNQLKTVQSIPGVIELTPPITMSLTGQTTNQIVNDCFATDAKTVVDLFNNETYIRQNGTFVKLNTTLQ